MKTLARILNFENQNISCWHNKENFSWSFVSIGQEPEKFCFYLELKIPSSQKQQHCRLKTNMAFLGGHVKALHLLCFQGSKETAFLYAITTAGVVHTVARACSSGNLTECNCDRFFVKYFMFSKYGIFCINAFMAIFSFLFWFQYNFFSGAPKEETPQKDGNGAAAGGKMFCCICICLCVYLYVFVFYFLKMD